MFLLRFIKIIFIALRYGLDQILFDAIKDNTPFLSRCTSWRHFTQARAVRLRLALERLGPIFIKFGQMLSTRPDMIPSDFIKELSLLQDQVPPFSSEEVNTILKDCYPQSIEQIFKNFNLTPAASASVAQVHFAELLDGTPVAVKILRPGIEKTIQSDLKLMRYFASFIHRVWPACRRLKPKEIVQEFSNALNDELDLMHEAANCSQLRRNFSKSDILIVPEVYWDWCGHSIMVMERMHGIPISHIQELDRQGIDRKVLSERGLEIFFIQVFRDGFFHADMHPGNIFVDTSGRYIGLDFGIMGTLNEEDKRYLAINFLAFFKRDYHMVAVAHVEAGWVPPDTRIDELESAIRTVCEPIFDRPLKDISFGKTLLRLFQTARRFNMEIQPQLLLLQKTLLNVEGLGRELNPDLDLWKTAKPFLENWVKGQIGLRAFVHYLKQEMPKWPEILSEFPRLAHTHLKQKMQHEQRLQQQFDALITLQNKNKRLMVSCLCILCCMGGVLIYHYY